MAEFPSSLSEQVEDIKSYEISYRVLHPKAIIKDKYTNKEITIPYSSLTNKYRHFLSKIIHTVTMDEEVASLYWYRPKRMSMDLYGTTEFWNDLLILNNCISVAEFKLRKVRSYDPNQLKEYINEILILEGLLD